MFGLSCNQTGGARTLAHLQEGPTAKKKVPARGADEAAGIFFFPRLQSDNSWGGVRGCGPRARSAPWTGGNSRRIVFTPLVKTATVEMQNVPAVVVHF